MQIPPSVYRSRKGICKKSVEIPFCCCLTKFLAFPLFWQSLPAAEQHAKRLCKLFSHSRWCMAEVIIWKLRKKQSRLFDSFLHTKTDCKTTPFVSQYFLLSGLPAFLPIPPSLLLSLPLLYVLCECIRVCMHACVRVCVLFVCKAH